MDLTLVFPHQLFAHHPALRLDTEVWLIEDPLWFGTDPRWPLAVHRQRLVLYRAAMKAYAKRLGSQGYTVRYLEFHQTPPWPQGPGKLYLADPLDDLLSRRLATLARSQGLECVVYPSPNQLSPAEFVRSQCHGKRKPFMARFYQAQRQRMGLLLEPDGSPTGGKWSFDVDNRLRLPNGYQPPPPPRTPVNAEVEEAIRYVEQHFPNHPGKLDDFRWPVTHHDAEAWLDAFIAQRLEHFGAYEDAISTRHAFLHHSAITPALNIGLLDPAQVVERVLAKADVVPLNSLEGFVRQVIGWREFIMALYLGRGHTLRTSNFWKFTRPMPRSFYDASTGIPPVDRVIRQLLETGYCHHIERLMVLGNFMLLCRIHPDEVYRWFMELFIDATDWVMVPNVYGMSQFADGGTFTTKPYLSGSNYLLKMSDEARGPWCDVWDGLYWTFIADHQDFFRSNPRLSMMAVMWDRMSPEKQAAHRRHAASWLEPAAESVRQSSHAS